MGMERVAMDALAADAAFQRGIRAMPTKDDFHVFLAPGQAKKVGAAVWWHSSSSLVDANEGLLRVAFTTGSPCCSDNFDTFPNLGVRVENGTFGLGKVLCEKAELAALLENPMDFYQKNIDNPRLSSDFKHELERAAANPSVLLPPLFKALLIKGLEDTAAACQTWCKKIDASDPTHTLLPSMVSDVAVFKEEVFHKTSEEALERFGCIKQPMLDALRGMDPRVAKMGLGRGTLFSVMGSRWEGEGRLHMWSVFFARIFLLCEAGDAAVYTFFMLNVYGIQCEFSDKDNVWAILNKSQLGGGALCDLLLSSEQTKEQEKIKALMQSDERKHKLLGVANGWVAAWLKHRVGFSETPLFSSEPELENEMEAAKEYLCRIGWDTAFLRIFVPDSTTTSVFSPRPISPSCAELMRTTIPKDVIHFVSRFSLRLSSSSSSVEAYIDAHPSVASIIAAPSAVVKEFDSIIASSSVEEVASIASSLVEKVASIASSLVASVDSSSMASIASSSTEKVTCEAVMGDVVAQVTANIQTMEEDATTNKKRLRDTAAAPVHSEDDDEPPAIRHASAGSV